MGVSSLTRRRRRWPWFLIKTERYMCLGESLERRSTWRKLILANLGTYLVGHMGALMFPALCKSTTKHPNLSSILLLFCILTIQHGICFLCFVHPLSLYSSDCVSVYCYVLSCRFLIILILDGGQSYKQTVLLLTFFSFFVWSCIESSKLWKEPYFLFILLRCCDKFIYATV